ncbi:superoxide dismutase [Candidatus Neomarinimicrobiota bacterium]
MTHTAREFNQLLGKLDGISDKQLTAHFGLYKGYVARLNLMEAELKTTDKSHTNYSWGHWSELKRREAVALNGAYLHELYFENLLSKGEPDAALLAAITESFGSYAELTADLKATALCTIGWVVLTKSRIDGHLHTYLMTEHHVGYPVHQDIVLVLDSYEHAFAIDYGTDRGTYIDAFLKNINWEVVNDRFAKL